MKDQAADEVAEKVRKELTDGAYWMSTYGTSLAVTSWHKYAKANKQSSRLKATVSEDGKTVDKFDSEKLLWTAREERHRKIDLALSHQRPSPSLKRQRSHGRYGSNNTPG